MMMFLARVLADPAVLTKFQVDQDNLNATSIPIYYNTLEGNQPLTNKNTVYLWQTDGWDTSVNHLKTFPINSDQASGPQSFDVELANVNYLIGYAVGEGKGAVVTTQRLETQGGGKWNVIPAPDTEALSFEMTNVNTTTVSYSFRIPNGTSAEANGDWIGVWKGSTGSYLYDKDKQPISLKSISIDDSYGNDRLTLSGGQQFTSGASYMLGYFKSGYDSKNPNGSVRTTLAAIVKFKGP
ncbi:hypothetical protein [Mycetohabitans rhizoxinica]|uniref:hypothetical protein n=1 Tax=Mycetohabitans rhizoxinica TaxID=412963 RepID=UPI0030D46006